MSKNVNLQVKINTSLFSDNNFSLGTEMKNSFIINENSFYRNEQNFINDNENKFINELDSIMDDQNCKNDITSSINLYDNTNIQNSLTVDECNNSNKNLINSTSNTNLNDNDTLDLSLNFSNSQNFSKNNILIPKLANQFNCVNFHENKFQEDFEKKNIKNDYTKANSVKNSPSQSPSTSYTNLENQKNFNCYNIDNSSIKSSVSTNASSSSSPIHYSAINSNAFIVNSSYENLNINSSKNSLCLKDLNNTLKYSPSIETSDYYTLPLQNNLSMNSDFSLPKDILQKKENTRSNLFTQNKKNRHCLNEIEDENVVSSKTVKKFCVNNYNSNVSSLEDNTNYFNNTEPIKNNEAKFIFSNNNFSYVSNSYINNSTNTLMNTAGSCESLVINEENDNLENYFNDSDEKIFCNHQNFRSDINYTQRHSTYTPEISNIYNFQNQMILPLSSSFISTPSMVNQFLSQTTKFISEPATQCSVIENQNFQSQFQNSLKPQQQALIQPVSKSSTQSQTPPVSLETQSQQLSSSSIMCLQEKESNSFQNYFQHVLTANTSMASKLHEESMTYLNQGQSYEIKLRKSPLLGYSGNILKSVIRIGFQERRLQYMEKELIQQWKQQRESERILEIDIPLSYGVFEIIHPDDDINKCEFAWDPKKLAGVFIKLNCISTEFTPKKHGGEKGVPFKLIIETHTYNNKSPINMQTFIEGASCQVKVFKPKGADRKHKTDKEKMAKRSSVEQQKFLPSCDCTIFKPCSKESLFLDYNTYNNNINSLTKAKNKNNFSICNKNKSKINSNSKCKNGYASFNCNNVFNNSNENFNQKTNESNNYNSSDFINSTTNNLTLTDGICSSNTSNDFNVSTISSTKTSFNINENCKTNSLMQNQINSNLEKCNSLNISNLLCTNSNSNNSLANLIGIYNCSLDLISNLDNSNNFLTNSFLNSPLPNNLDSERTREWLIVNRFEKYSHLFQNYNSNDLLSLSREDLIQICSLIDGIRLYNILHLKASIPKLTIYLSFDTGIFKAVYLNSYKHEELKEKIYKLLCENNENNSEFNFSFTNLKQLILLGPQEIKVLITEEVITNFGSESMFFVQIEQDINSNNYDFLLKPYKQNNF